MNPQLNLLDSNNLLVPMQRLIVSFLTSTPQTSHEIKNLIKGNPLFNHLELLLSNYKPSGFKEEASFIGAICSDLAHKGRVQHSKKECYIKGVVEDAFSI